MENRRLKILGKRKQKIEKDVIRMMVKVRKMIPDPIIGMEVKCDMFNYHLLNMFVYRL